VTGLRAHATAPGAPGIAFERGERQEGRLGPLPAAASGARPARPRGGGGLVRRPPADVLRSRTDSIPSATGREVGARGAGASVRGGGEAGAARRSPLSEVGAAAPWCPPAAGRTVRAVARRPRSVARSMRVRGFGRAWAGLGGSAAGFVLASRTRDGTAPAGPPPPRAAAAPTEPVPAGLPLAGLRSVGVPLGRANLAA